MRVYRFPQPNLREHVLLQPLIVFATGVTAMLGDRLHTGHADRLTSRGGFHIGIRGASALVVLVLVSLVRSGWMQKARSFCLAAGACSYEI